LRNQTSTASRFTRMISCFHLYLSTNTYIYILRSCQLHGTPLFLSCRGLCFGLNFFL
jgi:hypothetical protein